MKVWFSLKDLLGVGGLPKSKQGLIERAMREGWKRETQTTQGGDSFRYHLSSLPARAQQELRALNPSDLAESAAFQEGKAIAARMALTEKIDQQVQQKQQVQSLIKSQRMSKSAQHRIDTRLAVLRLLDEYARTHCLSISKAEFAFAEAYNKREVEAADEVRSTIGSISRSTLQEWRSLLREHGVSGLAGDYGNRKNDGVLDRQTEMGELVQALLVEHPHSKATQVMKAIEARFGAAIARGELQLPAVRTVRDWIQRWKKRNPELLTAITNPDEWKNKYMVAFGSASDGIDGLNQLWEMDSTPGDVMLTDGRHAVIGVIDVGTRRKKLLVSKTSKAAAIATLIRRALLDWGVPEGIKTDNGQDYLAQHVTRTLKSLHIRHEVCQPFSPWQKPHIERGLGTFSRDLVELLDGYIGHNVAERKAIEARQSFADKLMKRGDAIEVKLSSQEFQVFCDRWCEDVYQHAAHSGLKGKTPFQVAAEWTGPIRRISPDEERGLDVLLAPAGMATVQKKGIQRDDAHFIAVELEAYVGQRVEIREDEHDLGRLYVFGGDDMSFICVAECPERTGLDRREVAIRARQKQKQRVQEERAAMRAIAKKAKTDDIVKEILEDRASKAGKLALLPRKSEDHTTPDLQAAATALSATHTPAFRNRAVDTVQPPDARTQEIMRQLEQRTSAEVVQHPRMARPVHTSEADVQRRFTRARDLEARIAAGQTIGDQDQRWLTSYQGTAEYLGQLRFLRAFGEAGD